MLRITQSHADRVAAALAAGEAARSAVVASWARSLQVHGLSPVHRPIDERLMEAELARLREELGQVLDQARPTMRRLFEAVGGVGACVMLANADGIPIERLGKPAEDGDFAGAGLWVGTRWCEAAAGTNGIGTCLAETRPVLIHRDQHFLSANTGLTCASAPVHDPDGALVAVLDVSTVRAEVTEGLAGLMSHTVIEAARKIEADLFRVHFSRARVMLVPGSNLGLGALLAVDGDELVIGATRAARQHFDLMGDLEAAPVPLADVLGLSVAERPCDGERAVISRALARTAGNVSEAARLLGISRATLHRKLNRLDCRKP